MTRSTRTMSAHAEVSIAAMIARLGLMRRAAVVLLLSAATIRLVAVGGANAADPPVPGPLDRPIADLALIDGGSGSDAPPWMLTVDTEDQAPGTVRVALLYPAGGWQPVGTETIVLRDSPGEVGTPWETPWLIELQPDHYVMLSTSHQDASTTVVPIRTVPGDTSPLRIGQPITMSIAVDDAGAIDVDGDGTNELVVSSVTARRPSDVCQGSLVRVLDGTTLAQRSEWAVSNTRLAGGVLGEWDGRPGGDLLAYAYRNCPIGPDSATRLGIVALRLADGSQIVSIPPQDRSASAIAMAPGVPLAADLDGDGRDEVVIRDGEALVVLEPARDWERTEIASGDVMPLSASSASEHGAGTLVWLDHAVAEDNLVMSVGRIERAATGGLAMSSDRLDLAAVAPTRRARVLRSIRDVATTQAAPQAWIGDIDGDGCPDLVAPLLTTQCIADAQGQPTLHVTMKVGASWLATRPVGAFDVGDSRELLVVATMAWDPNAGMPLPATPAATSPPGGWRHGPSSRFALSQIRAADLAYFGVFPVPRPTIERAAVRGMATDFPGFTGARTLLRVTGVRSDDSPPSQAPTLDEFLSDPVASGEVVSVDRVPVPAAAESGRDGSFVHVSLADAVLPNGGPAERWTVTIAQLNDWGEIAGPVRGTIIEDLSGPSLTVDPPFLSAPWPMEATVHGRSEPGVEISGGTGGPVVADRRGRFELRTHLAPWPQGLQLTATDESGNTTTGQFSLVGGVDYRAFPWPAILAAFLLLGAIVSAGRGSQVVRKVDPMADGDPLPEIEELPSAGEWPRA